jgi:hypothetical protein
MDNLPERWKPTLLQVHSHPYSVVYAMALEIGAAEARIAELKEEAETIKQLEAATLPCGHTYRNAVIVDGGKRSYCIVCEQAYTIERLSGMQRFWDAQAEWSQATFGADHVRGPIGPLKHLEKEARECQAEPYDLEEKADCLFLIFDATRRSGRSLDSLLEAAEQKLAKNKSRSWPSMAPDDCAIEHIPDAALNPPQPQPCDFTGESMLQPPKEQPSRPTVTVLTGGGPTYGFPSIVDGE